MSVLLILAPLERRYIRVGQLEPLTLRTAIYKATMPIRFDACGIVGASTAGIARRGALHLTGHILTEWVETSHDHNA
jgi:hypothetical protein